LDGLTEPHFRLLILFLVGVLVGLVFLVVCLVFSLEARHFALRANRNTMQMSETCLTRNVEYMC